MLHVESGEDLTVVTFDHGPVHALDLELLRAIAETVGAVTTPLVLTGSGKAFSAGVDLRRIVDGGAAYAAEFVPALSEAFLAVFNHPRPVVAAINGHAIAGGAIIALAADYRVMSAGTIGITELSVGVPYPIAALEICRHALGTAVGRAALHAKTSSLTEAKAAGFVDETVLPEQLLDRACALARELGSYSPLAFEFTKRQLHRATLEAISEQSEHEELVRATWASFETRDRIESFLGALASRRS
jgi:enoyl-CoA hydratase